MNEQQIVNKILTESKLSQRLEIIVDNWDDISDHRGAICCAMYVSSRQLTDKEKQVAELLTNETT